MHGNLGLLVEIVGAAIVFGAVVAGALSLHESAPVTRERALWIFTGKPAHKRAAVLLGLLAAGEVSATTVQALWPESRGLPPIHPYVEAITLARRSPRLRADAEARLQRDLDALAHGRWTPGRPPLGLDPDTLAA